MTLSRLLASIETRPALPVTVTDGAGPVWCKASDWRVYTRVGKSSALDSVLDHFELADGSHVIASFDASRGEVALPFDPEEAYATLISEEWREGARPRELSPEKLAIYYRVKRFVPRGVQIRGRRLLARWQGIPAFPAWPFEPSAVELFRLFVQSHIVISRQDSLAFRWFWPSSAAAALTLTHDVESDVGLRLALEIASLEEDRGFRSSFNVVASWYRIDMGIIDELISRGFEIGVHGIYHDRSMFASRSNFDVQRELVRETAARFGASGFRSPATHRVFDWLGELPILYDCSIPHSDPYEPQPGGCCTVWPFFIGDVVELPYTLPQDHTLFTVLGQKTIDVWLGQVDRLVKCNGLIQAVTHPDPGYLGDSVKRALYAEFLDAMKGRDDLWCALPRDVAVWWRQRDAGTAGPFALGRGIARLAENDVEFVAERATQ